MAKVFLEKMRNELKLPKKYIEECHELIQSTNFIAQINLMLKIFLKMDYEMIWS